MDAWRDSFRRGFAPQLTTRGLEALRQALAANDPALLQMATTEPPPLRGVRDWPPAGACAVGYAGWKGLGLGTVGEVDDWFAATCFTADELLGEPAACRWFLNWADSTDRLEFVTFLLAEVEMELAGRANA